MDAYTRAVLFDLARDKAESVALDVRHNAVNTSIRIRTRSWENPYDFCPTTTLESNVQCLETLREDLKNLMQQTDELMGIVDALHDLYKDSDK